MSADINITCSYVFERLHAARFGVGLRFARLRGARVAFGDGRVREPLPHEADVFAQYVELVGERKRHLHVVHRRFDGVDAFERASRCEVSGPLIASCSIAMSAPY